MGETDGGVREFYAGRCVFITGATGYLGKVTLEKLLRSCPEIKKAYLLVRPKKGKSAQERLEELINSPAFDRIKKEQSSFASKIVLVTGNIAEPGLGLNDADVSMLSEEISVIIHNAATIRFTEPLKIAVKINICGVREMIKLAKMMKNLQAFVHVSTAYSNCNRKQVDEALYPQRLSPQQLISATSWLTDSELEVMLPWIINDYPNTYTFTKAMGELLLQDEKGNIPAAIVRPSIIVSSYSEPVPGWIDGLAGANGVFAVQGLGILRKMGGSLANIGDLIPVDMTANSTIVAGWMIAKKKPKDVFIINMTSGQLNPVKWGSSFENWTEQEYKYPCKNVVRPPTSRIFEPNNCIKNINQVVDHYLPGLVFDSLAKVTGQRPRYCKMLKSFGKFIVLMEYFASNEWHFKNTNVRLMYNSLSPDEKLIFNFDVTCVDWREFSRHWWLGIRQYVWKEDISRQDEYDRRFSRILVRRKLLRVAFGILVVSALVKCLPSGRVFIKNAAPFAGTYLTKAKDLLAATSNAVLLGIRRSQ